MNHSIYKLGFYSSLLSFAAVIGYGIVQVLQIGGVIGYPLDARLIYAFSLCIAPFYLLSIVSLHYTMPYQKKIWSHIALLFAVLYAAFVIIMYSVQLVTVIPQSLRDPSPTILTDTPQSFLWTLDAIGYICMGISTLFAAFAFTGDGLQKTIRLFLLANGLMVPVIAIVYFYPHFSIALLLIASPWMITTPGSLLLLAFFFKRKPGYHEQFNPY